MSIRDWSITANKQQTAKRFSGRRQKPKRFHFELAEKEKKRDNQFY